MGKPKKDIAVKERPEANIGKPLKRVRVMPLTEPPIPTHEPKLKKPRKKRTNFDRDTRPANKLIPNFVKEWREFRKIETQSELAKKSGLPSQTINQLEKHRLAYTVKTLEMLAKALDCLPGELVSFNPFAPTSEIGILTIYQRLSPEDKSLIAGIMAQMVGRNIQPTKK